MFLQSADFCQSVQPSFYGTLAEILVGILSGIVFAARLLSRPCYEDYQLGRAHGSSACLPYMPTLTPQNHPWPHQQIWQSQTGHAGNCLQHVASFCPYIYIYCIYIAAGC